MNKLAIITLALLGALLLVSTPVRAEDHAETIVSDNSKVGVENVDAGITAFDAYSLFYYGGTPKAQCYQCSSPCSAYACCPGAYPQCCWVNGLGCRCCRN